MKINVTNNTPNTVNVSINVWGESESTDYYEVTPNNYMSWFRNDSKAYILAVGANGNVLQYLVSTPNEITLVPTARSASTRRRRTRSVLRYAYLLE